MAGRILIVVHQETSTPGRVGLKLRQRGFELDIRRTCLGHALPETLDEHEGAIVFGGPMSANDGGELEFIKREIDWLDVPLREKAPFLGICLGAQLLAKSLGADVGLHPESRAEIGYYPIFPTDIGKAVCDWPSHVYQWHRESFEMPSGGQLMVAGDNHFRNQAFRYGKTAFGIQFHPEVTLAMTHRWTVHGAHRMGLPGVRPRSTHFSDRLVYDPAVDTWLEGFIDRWLGFDRRERRGRKAA